MEVILLEKIEKLGSIGDVVNVKPGYARNFLLPQEKALRATKDNISYFETQKKQIEKNNAELKKAAEALSTKIDGLTVSLIRQASEGGQLYGSVTSRDIAEAVNTENSAASLTKKHVILDRHYKMLGLYPVKIKLHPEVTAIVTINIARSAEEAKVQAERGEALIMNDEEKDLSEQAVDALVQEEQEQEQENENTDAEETVEEEVKLQESA